MVVEELFGRRIYGLDLCLTGPTAVTGLVLFSPPPPNRDFILDGDLSDNGIVLLGVARTWVSTGVIETLWGPQLESENAQIFLPRSCWKTY